MSTTVETGSRNPPRVVAALCLALAASAFSAGGPLAAGDDPAWAFHAPQRHRPPGVERSDWARQPIDVFVLARLEAAGLEPSPEADRRTLARRVTFDLTGLPPTPEGVEAFVRDPAPDAYERLVDRLLASPRHGERLARPWLDLARYAEDQAHIVGDDRSLCYPNAFLYRDWVIDAFNADLPYDRFVILQLAADLVESDGDHELAALGFLGLGPKYYNRGSLAVKADEWEDRVDVVGRGLLGLTVACARCHDHKFDPISTADYYALAGVFASTEMYNRPLDSTRATAQNGQAKDPADAMHIVREGKPTDLAVFVRGSVDNRGPVVPRHFLTALCADPPAPFRDGSGRLELARAIASRDNPLTARVIVNRIWGEVFGAPLVATPSNFGSLGSRPTHPELLDDLAVRFMEAGWSVRRLVRELVLSATYRQSSQARDAGLSRDPTDRLLWRMRRRRLEVEAWRDALLSVSCGIDARIGGPSVDLSDIATRRRTLYARVSRLDLDPLLALFDFPDPNVHAARRVETTTALQKLFLLNSRFMVQRAAELAHRLGVDAAGFPGEAGTTAVNGTAAVNGMPAVNGTVAGGEDETSGGTSGGDAAQRHGNTIRAAYRLLYARPATDAEVRLGAAFLERDGAPGPSRWREYLQVLLAANEMEYVD